jgi:hypothetical protein
MDKILRAANSLVAMHGKDAARVAEQRAENADLGGSMASAHIRRQIANVIRGIQRKPSKLPLLK